MTEGNPILNNPYREPEWHYATNLEGELDYEKSVKGRRMFTGIVQTVPVPGEPLGTRFRAVDQTAE